MPIKPLVICCSLCVIEIPGFAEEKWWNESNTASQKKKKETQERFINFNINKKNKNWTKPSSSSFTILWFVFLFTREKKWGASTNKVTKIIFHLEIDVNNSLNKGMGNNSSAPLVHFSSWNKNASNLNCIWVNLFHVCFLMLLNVMP